MPVRVERVAGSSLDSLYIVSQSRVCVPMGCAVCRPPRFLFASPLDVAPCLRGIFSDISNLPVSAHSRRYVLRTLALASMDSDDTVWHSVTWWRCLPAAVFVWSTEVGHAGTAARGGWNRVKDRSRVKLELGLKRTLCPRRGSGTLLSSGPSVLVCPLGGHSTVSVSCPEGMSLTSGLRWSHHVLRDAGRQLPDCTA